MLVPKEVVHPPITTQRNPMPAVRTLRALFATLVAAALSAPLSVQAATASTGPERFLVQLAEAINSYRADNGLEPLSLAGELAELANDHSSQMSERRQLSHDGFRDRFRNASSKLCVENVGWNFRTAEGLLEGWRRSPAHHRNLLEPKISRMGLAISARYVTFFACR